MRHAPFNEFVVPFVLQHTSVRLSKEHFSFFFWVISCGSYLISFFVERVTQFPDIASLDLHLHVDADSLLLVIYISLM